jgi:hypothetical protein
LNQNLKQVIDNYSGLDELKRCIDTEVKLNGSFLHDVVILDNQNQENSLYNILDKTSMMYSLVLLTSLESCSTCRDQALKVWNDIVEENSDLSIIILIAEDRELDKSDLRKVKAYMRGMNIKLPFLLSTDSQLFSHLGISPTQTPISLVVNRDKTIISSNRSSEATLERVTYFSELFKSLNIKGGER